jgi:hypothetical protein
LQHAHTVCATAESLEVECTHCGVRMSSHWGSGQTVNYFHCASCSRWSTNMYREVFRADSKMRTRKPVSEESAQRVGAVKNRLEKWLHALSESDPYQTLGLSPQATDAELKDRFRALARMHHPDHGGQEEHMRQINDAYERALSHRAQRLTRLSRPTALTSGT